MSTTPIPIVYTLTTCPACESLRTAWSDQGIKFEERQVDQRQEWLDEALNYAGEVPIAVYPNGKIEIGYADEIG